jgi:hypothetical protein
MAAENTHCALGLRNRGVLLTPLRILQIHGAFIAAFTSEKRWMTIKKRNWPLIPNFFIAHLSILVQSKTKGVVRVVCVFLRIWPLRAKWPITVEDGAESLKGSHRMEDGRIFLKDHRDTSFNKDLSNEPTFGLIHLAGQYL